MHGGDSDLDPTMDEWASGTLLDARHQLTRRYLLLGEVREAVVGRERLRGPRELILTRFDESRVMVQAPLPVLRRLGAAVRVGLTGPGRWAHPH